MSLLGVSTDTNTSADGTPAGPQSRAPSVYTVNQLYSVGERGVGVTTRYPTHGTFLINSPGVSQD